MISGLSYPSPMILMGPEGALKKWYRDRQTGSAGGQFFGPPEILCYDFSSLCREQPQMLLAYHAVSSEQKIPKR